MKKTVWTYCREAFSLGISNSPIKTEVEVIEEKSVGKGINAFSFKTPNNTLRIAESSSGAIVGDSFIEVETDIKNTDFDTCCDQINNARLQVACAKYLSPTDFFSIYKS